MELPIDELIAEREAVCKETAEVNRQQDDLRAHLDALGRRGREIDREIGAAMVKAGISFGSFWTY